MQEQRLPTVVSPALDSFAEVAREFCETIEAHRKLGREAFLRAVHGVLPRLYSAALALPPTRILFPKSDDSSDGRSTAAGGDRVEVDSDRLSAEEVGALCRSLGELIGERMYYREIYDPFEPLSEPEVLGFLADDFSDTYGDVKAGLRKWMRGESGEALWEWRFNFEHHWGEHLTGALRALFVLAARYEFVWPEGE